MLLSERHQIKPSHPSFKEIDGLCFLSKNLRNATLYIIRHQYFEYLKFKEANKDTEAKFKWLSYYDLEKNFKNANQKDYRALPAKVSQQVMMQVFQEFDSFWKAIKAYWKDKGKFNAKPSIPYYSDIKNGRNAIQFTNQAFVKRTKEGFYLVKTNIFIKPKTKKLVRHIIIHPQSFGYCIEIIYEKQEKKLKPNRNVASIDPGLNNLATITFNKQLNPLIIPGGPLKSINQYYNKRKAKEQSNLPKGRFSSKKIKQLGQKRTNKINDYLHKASRFLITHLVSQRITTLVIGKNTEWKQEINLGKKNNQNFVSVPIARFLDMVAYKAELMGIKVLFQEESYTSKCSFLDQETIEKHEEYAGKRIKRGLFETSYGSLLNADVNGSYNIMRKAIPNLTFKNGIEAVVVQPRKVRVSENTKKWFI